jgi:hypothetical protein
MDWMEQAFGHRLQQPDPTSCGAASLVVAQMTKDPAYAEFMMTGKHPGTGLTLAGSLEDRFKSETLAMHERVTGDKDARGRMQMPWPKALGTPPWAVARQISATSGTTYDVATVNPMGRRGSLGKIVDAASFGHVVPLYVGNRWSPRHVVLVLTPELEVYEPASGRRVQITEKGFVDAKLDLAGWDKPWVSVLPS